MKTVQFTVNTQYKRKPYKVGAVLDIQDDKDADDLIVSGLAKSYDKKAAAAAEAEAKKVAEAKAKAKADAKKSAENGGE